MHDTAGPAPALLRLLLLVLADSAPVCARRLVCTGFSILLFFFFSYDGTAVLE